MPKQPQDPFPIYKDGEKPRKVHAVDFAGWAAQGWSKEPPTEEAIAPAEPAEVSVPTTLAPPELPQVPPADPPAPPAKVKKASATRPTQPTDPAG